MSDQSGILRHRTARQRGQLSRPVKRVLADGLISASENLFDYGCGRGGDLALLREQGISCSGWDPSYQPAARKEDADVVNLGYVINVIEDPIERSNVLRSSWALCRKLLVVSAQVNISSRGRTAVPYGDGVVTACGTFQKFFDQAELGRYIENELGTEAVAAEPGIYYVFRDEAARQQFVANRFRRRVAAPRKRKADLLYEENRQLLDAFMEVIASLGRLPESGEWDQIGAVSERFGSLKRAFSLVRRLTGPEEWANIAERRREDMLVFLALARFRKRPRFSQMPRPLQVDIKSFLGTYSKACHEADDLLFRVGNSETIDDACKRSTVGKLLPDDLYIHRSALDSLEPVLRIYEGCGRSYLGEVEGANIIKIHRRSGKISYLVYPDFDTDPHPALFRSVKLSLRTRQLECFEYAQSLNPPVLHRKETFLHPEHPLFQKFSRLTRQEERHGLLADTAGIGTRQGWEARLHVAGFSLRGHRLVKT